MNRATVPQSNSSSLVSAQSPSSATSTEPWQSVQSSESSRSSQSRHVSSYAAPLAMQRASKWRVVSWWCFAPTEPEDCTKNRLWNLQELMLIQHIACFRLQRANSSAGLWSTFVSIEPLVPTTMRGSRKFSQVCCHLLAKRLQLSSTQLPFLIFVRVDRNQEASARSAASGLQGYGAQAKINSSAARQRKVWTSWQFVNPFALRYSSHAGTWQESKNTLKWKAYSRVNDCTTFCHWPFPLFPLRSPSFSCKHTEGCVRRRHDTKNLSMYNAQPDLSPRLSTHENPFSRTSSSLQDPHLGGYAWMFFPRRRVDMRLPAGARQINTSGNGLV